MTHEEILQLLACPSCGGALASRGSPPTLLCSTCDTPYPIVDGIPVLLRPELRELQARGGADAHKHRQALYFDQPPLDDFGVTRPRGAPRLYGWLLEEKFRRGVLGLEPLLPGGTALTICGGSGMDAEFLARTGARVILSDISLGVLRQGQERAKRYGLDIVPLVADAETLPFRDAAVDLVYVHDGLHHLEEPALALREMARVARHAISVNEPAESVATTVAVRLGVAEVEEEAGNRVRRLTLDEIVDELEGRGFGVIRPHRYAMYYRHWPGLGTRLLSLPGLYEAVRAIFLAGNVVFGRFGNKLAIQARRDAT